MTRKKPTDKEFKNFWSVYEAKQQRKRDQLKTIPPSNFTENQKEQPE